MLGHPPGGLCKEKLGTFKVRTKGRGSFNGCNSSLKISNLDTLQQVENLLVVSEVSIAMLDKLVPFFMKLLVLNNTTGKSSTSILFIVIDLANVVLSE